MTFDFCVCAVVAAAVSGGFAIGYALGVVTTARAIERHTSDWSDQ